VERSLSETRDRNIWRRALMIWLLGFLRACGARQGVLVFINHLHVHSGGRNLGDGSRRRIAGPPTLQSTAAPRPTIQIHLASARRERISDALAAGEREHVRAGWKNVMQDIEERTKRR
jgi:hypothetical protein